MTLQLRGWINPETLEEAIGPKHIMTEEELAESEPDRTNGQAKKIMDLMVKHGYKKITDIHGSFVPKKNGMLSVGMAAKVIDKLLSK